MNYNLYPSRGIRSQQAELYFSHHDYLGTERVKTDQTGAVAHTCRYGPFGDNESCTGGINSMVKYAGYDRDSESGLDHMWFRYYNPRLGRFMTTDPYDGSMDLSDPQSLNRYVYVGNNPVNYYDPLGLCILLHHSDGYFDQGKGEYVVHDWDEYILCNGDQGQPASWERFPIEIDIGNPIPPVRIGVAPIVPKPPVQVVRTAQDYQKANECIALGALKFGAGILPLPDDVIDPSDPIGSAIAVATKFADFLASPLGAGTVAMKLNVTGKLAGKFLRKAALPVAIVTSGVNTYDYLKQREAQGQCGK